MSDSRRSRTIHIVDDDESVRRSAAFLLQAAGYNVGIYASGTVMLDVASRLAPGCVLADVRMPGLNGLDLQEKLASLRSDLPVVIMTGHGDVPMAVRAMRAGAVDFIEKPFEEDVLIAAIETALAQAARLSSARTESERTAERMESLTPREREVMGLLVEGYSTKHIANALGISPRTIEVYRAAVMEKMEAGNLARLVRMVLAAERMQQTELSRV